MKRRLMAMLMAVALILALVPASALADGEKADSGSVTINDVLYSLEGEILYISSEVADSSITYEWRSVFDISVVKNVVIYSGIKTIEYDAFNNCPNLERLTVHDGLTGIEAGAFLDCTKLRSISLPSGLTFISDSAFENTAFYNNDDNWENGVLYIGEYLLRAKEDISGSYTVKGGTTLMTSGAFYNCALLESITLPDTISVLGSHTFNGCSALKSITMSDAVWSIGYSAFANCTSLESIALPESLSVIQLKTFENCTALKSITIPEKVSDIGPYAFSGCSALADVYYGGVQAKWDRVSIGENNDPLQAADIHVKVFADQSVSVDGITYVFNNGTLTITGNGIAGFAEVHCEAAWKDYFDKDSVTEVIIGRGVNGVGGSSFMDCANLKSVTIGEDVMSIGDRAFENCTSLDSISLGSGITSIGAYIVSTSPFFNTAYYNNPDNWENGVLYIGKYLIDAKTDISGECRIKDGTELIAGSAFYGCSELTAVTVPDSVSCIGTFAFRECTKLTDISLGRGVVRIREDAFTDCGAYNDAGNYENGVLYIDGCLISTNRKLSGTYTAKSGTRLIADYAFCACPELVGIVIPDSVKSIGSCILWNSGKVTEISLGNGITYISPSAFNGSEYYFNEANWENGVLYIGNYLIAARSSVAGAYEVKDGTQMICESAFHWNSALESVTIPVSVTIIAPRAFVGCHALSDVYYQGAKAQWNKVEMGDNPRLFTANVHFAIEDDVIYTLENGTLFVEGTGLCDSTWTQYVDAEDIKSIVICDGITELDWGVFSQLPNLESVKIAGSVKLIGGNSFFKCPKLSSIELSVGIEELGWGVFNDCTSLKSISIPDGVKKLDYFVFDGCTALESIDLPDSLTSIGSHTFRNTAFYNDDANWENGVLYIGSCLIEATPTLAGDYEIADGTRLIACYAFDMCTLLSTVTIPASVKYICDSAFNGNTSLTCVTFEDESGSAHARSVRAVRAAAPDTGALSIGNGAFMDCSALGKVILPDNVGRIGSNAFHNTAYYNDTANWDSGVLYLDDYLLCTDQSVQGDLIVKDGTKFIADGAFSNTAVTSVTVPESVERIGSSAFDDCPELEKIDYSGTKAQWKEISSDTHDGVLQTQQLQSGSITVDGVTYSVSDGKLTVSGTGECSALWQDTFDVGCVTAVVIETGISSIGEKAFCGSGVEDVYYGATAKHWSMIDIAKFNEPLLCATLHCSDKTLEPFPDVPVHEYYFYPVQWALASGMTTGSDNGNFDPEGVCTRGQIVTLLWRAAGEPIVDTDTEFTDVPEGKYYYDAVRWAVSQGITNGIGNGLFDPESACTRAQVVTFLHRAAGKPVPTKNITFPDVKYGEFYYTPVAWAAENGITVGSDNGLFDHNSTCTRNQVMTFMYRARDFIM